VYQQQEQQQQEQEQEQQQDAENPFLDPPFSRIKSKWVVADGWLQTDRQTDRQTDGRTECSLNQMRSIRRTSDCDNQGLGG
jgi:hypothetical protein